MTTQISQKPTTYSTATTPFDFSAKVIPEDILMKIFSWLSWKRERAKESELLPLSMCCKRFRQIAFLKDQSGDRAIS